VDKATPGITVTPLDMLSNRRMKPNETRQATSSQRPEPRRNSTDYECNVDPL